LNFVSEESVQATILEAAVTSHILSVNAPAASGDDGWSFI
jgi:hypothetical protein